MNDTTNSALGPPVEPPDDAWASALSEAVNAGPEEATRLVDLVPSGGALSDEVWASPTGQDPDADLLDLAGQDVGDPADLDTDNDSDLDPEPGSGSGGDSWWADDPSAHPDPGSDPGVDPGSPANTGDVGGWQ